MDALVRAQVFGKDIRALLAISCQKVFFEEGHSFYHYGPLEIQSTHRVGEMDLHVSSCIGEALPYVSREKRANKHTLVLTDRVWEYGYLRRILEAVFERMQGVRLKTDNEALNLSLLSLQLDFGLFDAHAGLLNLPFLQSLRPGSMDKRQLQVEVMCERT